MKEITISLKRKKGKYYKKKRKENCLSAFLISIFIFMILWFLIPKVYYVNDDRMMMQFLSGQFTGTPEPYCIYWGFPLSWCVSKLYLFFPAIDWYVLLLLLCNLISLWIYLYYVAHYSRSLIITLLMATSFLVFYACGFISPTYTLTSAMLGGAAIVIAMLGEYKISDVVLISTVVFLSYNLRKQCFFMCLPLFLLCFLYQLSLRVYRKKISITVFLLIFIVGICFVINSNAYQKDGWNDYIKYNEDRTIVMDYAMTGNKDPRAYIIDSADMTPVEYSCFLQYSFLLEPDLKTKISEIADIYRDEPDVFTEKSFGDLVYELIINYKWIILWAVMLSTICLLLSVLQRDYRKCLWELCSIVGSGMIVFYLMWKGRMPERVMNPAISLISLIAIIWLAMTIDSQENNVKKERWKVWEKRILLISLCIGIVLNAVIIRQVIRVENNSLEDSKHYMQFKEYCQTHEENIYFTTAVSLPYGYNYSIIENSTQQLNYVELGNWDTFSPLSDKMLSAYRISNVREYINTHDNVRIAVASKMNQSKGHLDYITYTLPSSWTYEIEDEVGVYTIYKINKNGENLN